jgi:hypothetical protein
MLTDVVRLKPQSALSTTVHRVLAGDKLPADFGVVQSVWEA